MLADPDGVGVGVAVIVLGHLPMVEGPDGGSITRER